MERHKNSSASNDTKKRHTPETRQSEETLSAEMLQRYLKGLGRCKKQRQRSSLSQELYRLTSS